MRKLLALLLVSPVAFTTPSENTKKFIWLENVSMLTFGTYRCQQELTESRDRNASSYLRTTGAVCDYVYDKDQIRIRATVTDINLFLMGWADDEKEKILETGEMSLDMVATACKKVADDIFAVGMSLNSDWFLHPFVSYFLNTGIVDAGQDQDKMREHIIDMFAVMIRIPTSTNSYNGTGYTCEANARDKKYKLMEDINFSIKKETTEDFFNRL